VPKGVKKGKNISFWWAMHAQYEAFLNKIDRETKQSDSDEEEQRKEKELKKAAKKASKKKSKKKKKDEL
jgi:hypothetical protein